MSISIRAATTEDVKAINDIANWYITNSAANFDTEPWTLTKRRDWLLSFQPPYHCLVAIVQQQCVGFACNAQFRHKAAYDSSTETTIYVDSSNHARGIGKMLYTALIEKVIAEDFHRAYAMIALPNVPSIRLHENLQFKSVGMLDEIGKKFGEYHSVAIYEKALRG